MLFTQNKPGLADSPASKKGAKIISIEDIRWGRRDIKTVQLLYPSMGKMMAKKAGCDDAWMIEDGYVTEGTSNNAYYVKDGKIVTRPLSNDILHGITRKAVLRLAEEAQMEIEERLFTIDEAKEADEAFTTSASAFVMPVVEIDGVHTGRRHAGPDRQASARDLSGRKPQHCDLIAVCARVNSEETKRPPRGRPFFMFS